MIFLTSILVWSNCNTPKQKSWNLAPKGMQECPSKPLVFRDQKRVKSPHPLTFSALTLATSFAPWVVIRFIGLPGIFDLNLVLLFLCHCRFLEDLNCFLQIWTKRHLYVLVLHPCTVESTDLNPDINQPSNKIQQIEMMSDYMTGCAQDCWNGML